MTISMATLISSKIKFNLVVFAKNKVKASNQWKTNVLQQSHHQENMKCHKKVKTSEKVITSSTVCFFFLIKVCLFPHRMSSVFTWAMHLIFCWNILHCYITGPAASIQEQSTGVSNSDKNKTPVATQRDETWIFSIFA